MRSLRVLISIAIVLGAVASPASAELIPGTGPRCRVAEPAGPVQSPPDDGLQVATFNVLHGLNNDTNYPAHATLEQRTQMQARQIAASGADIVGLQEVSVFRIGEAETVYMAEELAEELAAETGEVWESCWFLANPHFPAEPDLQEGGGGPISDFEATLVSQFIESEYSVFKEGVAIVSRYDIDESDGIHLPGRHPGEVPLCLVESFPPDPADPAAGPLCAATAGFETRAAIWARVIGTPEGAVDITSTHLAHDITQSSDVSSLEQAVAAAGFARAHAGQGDPAHVFFACDCNSQPDDQVPVVSTIESFGFTNTFTASCEDAGDAGCTAGADVIVTGEPARAMTERLDYVFAGDTTCTDDAGLIVNEPVAFGDGWLWPSDHIGVIASVEDCSTY